jgi:Arc-like DNA binding domain
MGQMAKRKRTDVVKLQLRIREALRRKLEVEANREERSLNSEIAHRLENSFDEQKNSLVLAALLAPGAGLELIRGVGTILRGAGSDWNKPPKSHAVAEAIRKLIAMLSGELPPTEESLPNRNERGSADQLAYLAALMRTYQEPGREGTARPLVKLIRAMEKD